MLGNTALHHISVGINALEEINKRITVTQTPWSRGQQWKITLLSTNPSPIGLTSHWHDTCSPGSYNEHLKWLAFSHRIDKYSHALP